MTDSGNRAAKSLRQVPIRDVLQIDESHGLSFDRRDSGLSGRVVAVSTPSSASVCACETSSQAGTLASAAG